MFLTRTANFLCDAALALVYPQSCAVCSGSVESRFDGIACARCWNETRTFADDETICWKCGAPAGGIIAEEKGEQVRCRHCDQEAFTAARACGVYEGAVRASVLALKHEPQICVRLHELLVRTQRRAPLNEATRIVAVPLHPKREKRRGFNQAAVIGRKLSRLTGLPFDEISLVRTSYSERHRAGLDERGRRETVENAFQVRHFNLVAGERILLVDDVFTTGATVSACARCLRDAGATKVFVLTIARALPY
jgi:ComF family protein